MSEGLTHTNLEGALPLVSQGKVRDIYAVDDSTLLFVATDRISAYDVILTNGIPSKGKLLTKISQFWFDFLSPITKTHIVDLNEKANGKTYDEALFERLPAQISENPKLRAQLEGRSLLVNKYKLIPLEVIVRGYITGSAWSEYKKTKTIHGIKIDEDLKESQALPKPLYTPSTKADIGDHDENIHPDKAVEILGGDKQLAERVEKLAIELYTKARDYAYTKGIIIADTKFEFGLDEDNNIVLVDEVLTPDSSRFWSVKGYEVGKPQNSYDKQFLRDWLTSNNLKGVDGVAMPEDIVEQTKAKYIEAYELLTGAKWQD